MSQPAKSNADILKETTVSNNVDSSAFDKQTTSSDSSSSNQTTMPAGIPEPRNDPNNTIQDNTKTVDVSNIPTEGYGLKDFEDVLAGKSPEVKVVEKPKEEPVVEDKEPEPVIPAQETPTKVAPKPAQTLKAGERDYSDCTEEEKVALKHISNQAFNFIIPKIKQLKNITNEITKKNEEIAQLKTGKQMLPDNYFEHPQAFVLTKDYNDNAKYLNDAASVQRHWQQQLVNIRQGEPYRDIDIENGRFVYGKEKVGDAKDEVEVMSYLQHSINQVGEFQKKVMGIESSFKERHSKAVETLKKAEKDNFSVYDEPNHPWKPCIEHLMQQIPAEFRNNPMASLLAKSGTAVLQMGKLLRDTQAELAELKKNGTKAPIESKQSQGGPTKDSVSSNGGSGKQENSIGTDINDFTKAMEM